MRIVLYTVGILFHVEECIRLVYSSSIIFHDLANIAYNHHTNNNQPTHPTLQIYIFQQKGELKNDELLEGMDKNALIELLLKERASSREGGGVTTGGRRRGLELDQTENKNQSKLVLSSIGEEGVGAGQEQGGDLLLSSSRPNSQVRKKEIHLELCLYLYISVP